MLWQQQCRVEHGLALQQYPAIFYMVTVLPLVAPWSHTLSGLIRSNIRVMAYTFAACTDWLVGYSRHPVRSLLAQWLGFGFTASTVVFSHLLQSVDSSVCQWLFFLCHTHLHGFLVHSWCYFSRWASFSWADYIAVPRVIPRPVLNRWPAKALSVNPFRKLTTLPFSPIVRAVR